MEHKSKFVELGGLLPIGGNTYAPTTEEYIRNIEQIVGSQIPEGFRIFTKTFGATSFGEMVKFRSATPLPAPISTSGDAYFGHFYGAKIGKSNSDLRESAYCYQGRMPAEIIPIGDDGMGNQICLGVCGDACGKVYYWDHNNEITDYGFEEHPAFPTFNKGKWRNVYLIADSFDDFIDRLYVADSEL